MKRSVLTLSTLLGLAVTVCLAAGCGGNGSGSNATVRILNASPALNAIEYSIDSESVSDPVQYTEMSPSEGVDTGVHRLRVRAPGVVEWTIDEHFPALIDMTTTIVVTGYLGKVIPVYLNDAIQETPNGYALLRVGAFAPALGAVDVYVIDPNDDTNLANKEADIGSVSYKDVTKYLSVKEGQWKVVLTSPGTKTILYRTDPLDLRAGSVMSLFVLETLGGGFPLQSTLIQDN